MCVCVCVCVYVHYEAIIRTSSSLRVGPCIIVMLLLIVCLSAIDCNCSHYVRLIVVCVGVIHLLLSVIKHILDKNPLVIISVAHLQMREGGREGGREGEGGRGREGVREGGREGGREGVRREGGREGGRE